MACATGSLPRFLADGLLTAVQVNDVTEHLLGFTGRATDPAAAERGAAVFAENCVACHGELGKGDPALGAPNLTDQIWLYGSTKQAVVNQVTKPHQGVMPTWATRLSDVEIKQAATYVHSLGGGQ